MLPLWLHRYKNVDQLALGRKPVIDIVAVLRAASQEQIIRTHRDLIVAGNSLNMTRRCVIGERWTTGGFRTSGSPLHTGSVVFLQGFSVS